MQAGSAPAGPGPPPGWSGWGRGSRGCGGSRLAVKKNFRPAGHTHQTAPSRSFRTSGHRSMMNNHPRAASLTERLLSSTKFALAGSAFGGYSRGSPEISGALKPVLDHGFAALLEVRSCAIDFLFAPKPADGQRSREAKAVPQGHEDRRRSAAEPRTAAPLRADRRWATRIAAALALWEGASAKAVLWSPRIGSDGHSGSLTIAHQSGRGQAGDPDAGHLFALEAPCAGSPLSTHSP